MQGRELFSSPAKRGRWRRSRRRGRRRRYRLTNKAIRHVVRVGQHVRCRNPLNHDPSRCEPRIARLVPLRLIPHVVAPPIHLHRQPRRRAVEVQDVRTHRMLPPEPWQPISQIAKPQPKLHLRRRHLTSKPFRNRPDPFRRPHPESLSRRRPLRHGAYPHRATSPAAQGRRVTRHPSSPPLRSGGGGGEADGGGVPAVTACRPRLHPPPSANRLPATPPPSRRVSAPRHLPRCAGEESHASPFLSSPAQRGRWRRSRRRGRHRGHGLPTSPSSTAIGQPPARDAPSVTARIRTAPPPPLRRGGESRVTLPLLPCEAGEVAAKPTEGASLPLWPADLCFISPP